MMILFILFTVFLYLLPIFPFNIAWHSQRQKKAGQKECARWSSKKKPVKRDIMNCRMNNCALKVCLDCWMKLKFNLSWMTAEWISVKNAWQPFEHLLCHNFMLFIWRRLNRFFLVFVDLRRQRKSLFDHEQALRKHFFSWEMRWIILQFYEEFDSRLGHSFHVG